MEGFIKRVPGPLCDALVCYTLGSKTLGIAAGDLRGISRMALAHIGTVELTARVAKPLHERVMKKFPSTQKAGLLASRGLQALVFESVFVALYALAGKRLSREHIATAMAISTVRSICHGVLCQVAAQNKWSKEQVVSAQQGLRIAGNLVRVRVLSGQWHLKYNLLRIALSELSAIAISLCSGKAKK